MKLFRKLWPIGVIFGVWLLFFFQFFTKGLLPIPSDIITGVYYPWLDYKWGFPVGVPVKNPLLSDIPSLLYPWRSLAVNQLKSFHWPLWNPYYFAGMPLLANFQSAVFSYVNVFFLFLPKALAWSAGVMLSPLVTLLAIYAFLRHKNLTKISSLLGAIVFAFCGFEIAWLEYNVHGHTALFLLLLLLATDKILQQKSRFWLFSLPVLVAFQIFSGYIPIVIYSYLVCFFYIILMNFLPELKGRRIDFKKYFLLGIFWVWGILLAFIQILPGFELTKNSIRLIDPTVEASEASYLPIANVSTLLAPDFFGNPATRNYFGKAFYDNFYFFVGTGTLILVFLAIFNFKKEKEVIFWLFVLLFSFVLVLKNPLGAFLEKSFLLSGGVAARALFITDFSLVILAAFGMERFFKSKNFKKEILGAIVLIGGAFFLLFLSSFKIGNQTNRLVAQRNLVIPFFFLVTCSSVTIASFSTRPKKILGLLFLFLITSQLLYSARKYLPFSKKELLFPKTTVIEFLVEKKSQTKEPFRVEIGEVIPQNFLMPYEIETTSGYDALLPKRIGEFLSILEIGKIAERISRVQLIKNFDSPVFPLLNTKYILAKKMNERGEYSSTGKPPQQFENPRYQLVFEDKTVQIYEDKKYLPRAFGAHQYKLAKNPKEFIEKATTTDFSKEVILEENPNFEIPKLKSKIDKIEWLEYEPGRIIFVTESDQPGFVFIANNYFSGWQGNIDGRPTKILRANYTFQAVLVESGRHLVTLEYKPEVFLKGGIISLFFFLNWLMFSFLVLLKNLWGKVHF